MHPLYLFTSVLEYIDVPGKARCITMVGEHLGGKDDNIERVDTAVTQLYMIHRHLGGDIRVDCLGVPEITYPCDFDGVNDEGAIATFSRFVNIEIFPK